MTSSPDADWREPKLISRVVENASDTRGKTRWFKRHPNPEVSIEQQLPQRPASHSLSGLRNPTISPRRRLFPAMHPSRPPIGFSGDGETTSATGFQNRV